ncbi:DnaJ family domain-containing protein [Shimia sp. SDUM112013]|uniref:DnaJ family domain-containing protein n=1 Tax=Shimia sp. SDUM112013 TaxID=3136160 RepID=UPI0032EE66CA
MKWRDLAEHQIQKAKAEGQFDGLAGQGRPLPPRAGGDIMSAGLGIMAEAGVLPREIQLKKAVDAQRDSLKAETDPTRQKEIMRKLADLEMKLAIEQEARRKFYRTT